MTIKRKEHISETFKGLRAGIVASYDRIDGKANELNIVIIDEEYDDKKEYASLTMNEMEAYSCIELLEKMRNEVWGTGSVGPVELEVFEKVCQDLEKILPAFRSSLPEVITERLNNIFEKYGMVLLDDEGPQPGKD